MSWFTASGKRLIAGTTVLTMALGHDFGTPPASGGGGGPLTLDDFSRDMMVYGARVSVGQDDADIPVSGTGPVGWVVEARVVSEAVSGEGTTGWATVATVSAAGTWLGSLTVELTRPWLRLEARLQAAPATTAITANRFTVGYVIASWGQSLQARALLTSGDTLTPPALVTVKQQVLNLANPGMSGRTEMAAPNVASAGNLPAGASLSGGVITITGTRTITNWQFQDYRVDVANGAVVEFRQCLWSESAPSAVSGGYMLYLRNGGRARIRDCTFRGANLGGGLAAAIKEEYGSAVSYGKSLTERCRFIHLPSDALKLVAGSCRWSYMFWENNTGAPGAISLWNSGTTYATGDYAANASGNVFVSLQNGNLNNPVPSNKSSDAFWSNIDPHVDAVTIEHSVEPVWLEYNLIDMSKGILAYGGTGMNNYFRWAPNTGSYTEAGSTARFNYLARDPAENSFPYQVTAGFNSPVTLYGNWMENGGGSAYIYPVQASQSVEWTGMKDLTDTPIATPTNCTAGTFTDETNDNVVQHIWNNRSPMGSGSIVHHFSTAASTVTSSLRIMANIALMELVGYKFVWLHHAVSGSGFAQLFSDGEPVATGAREWADDAAIHAYATADGGTVSTAVSAWNSAPAGLGLNYAHAIYELFTKKNWTTGAALTAPFTYPSTNPMWTAEHFWGDIYDTTQVNWTILGPNSNSLDEDRMNSLRRATDAVDFSAKNYMRMGQSQDTVLADPKATGVFTKQGLVPYWQTGQSNDYAHPRQDSVWGSGHYMGQMIHGALQGAGVRKWKIGVFDNVFWAADGSYVEVWSSDYDVTTMRKYLGWADLPATYPHWTDVWGFEWCVGAPDLNNGVGITPIESARLVATDGSGTLTAQGRVRILKPSAGTWASGDTLLYGYGNASGALKYTQDQDNNSWANRPVTMVGAIGADGGQVGMAMKSRVQFTRP